MNSPSRGLRTRRVLFFGLLTFVLTSLVAYAEDKPASEKKIREIFVPFEDLDVMLEGHDQRVFLTRDEYEQLLQKARLVAAEEKAPRTRVFLSADYDMAIQDGRATIDATLSFEVLTDELLGISLSIGGLNLRTATLDGQPAAVGRDEQNLPRVFVRGRGRHELKLTMMAPVAMTAAQQMLHFELLTPTATRWRLTVPGNVELKSGTSVISRTIDESPGVTRFELMPQRGPVTLALSLNNRILMQERVVLARSVFLSELTQSYERLHATVSLAIPHGAVDRFTFLLPPGFEVVEVNAPTLARWAVTNRAADERVLEVTLREPTTEMVVMNIVAANNSPKWEDWKLPQLRPLDVANHVAVVGVLAEDRLSVESLTESRLIPIDVTALNAALPASVTKAEPGMAPIRMVAAYYAPQTDFNLAGVFRHNSAKLEVTSNLLLTLSDKQLQIRGGFALLPKAEKLFEVSVQVSAPWQITAVTQNDGTNLPFELYPTEARGTRVRIRLPQGAAPGAFHNIFVQAQSVPAGWLNEWSQTSLPFPELKLIGADRDVGAVAIQTLDDLIARPDQLTGLTPLDEKEKAEFGIAGTASSLAYRYDSQPYSLRLNIERETPRLSARTFSFLRLEPEGLVAHYELLFEIERARARRISFQLPANTPEMIAIRGLDVPVKEFRSESVSNQGQAYRRWIAELAEPKTGTVRLAVDFQQSLPSAEPKNFSLPVVRAEGVDYQSGTVAVEGSSEFDVQVKTSARQVDVGELVDAQYQVGKRLLGAFGYVGESGPVLADVSRRPEYGLPAALVQRAELVTLLSAHGESQTAARYQLRTKAQFVELRLPPGAELWSATVDRRPASPQRERDRLLISLPLGGAETIRDLQLVYELPVSAIQLLGNVSASAPRLLLHDERSAQAREVPMADLQWRVVLPEGHELIRSSGTVFTQSVRPRGLGLDRSEAELPRLLITRSLARRSMRGAEAPATKATPMAEHRFRDAQKFGQPMSQLESFAVPPMTPPDMPPPAAPMTVEMKDGAVSSTIPVPTKPAQPDDQVQVPAGGEQATEQAPSVTSSVPQDRRETAASGSGNVDKYWALQGVRSLPIELVSKGTDVTFRSMGVEPRLNITLVNVARSWFLAAGLFLIVLVFGLAKTNRTAGHKAKFILAVVIATLLAPPAIGLATDLEVGAFLYPILYAAAVLVIWYVIVALVRWPVQIVTRRVATRLAATTAMVCVLGLFPGITPAVQAQQSPAASPEAAGSGTLNRELLELLAPPKPVKLPGDAIVIPYNADDPTGPKNATKVLVPYAQYVELWNRAYPDKPLDVSKPPAPYAIAGATYSVTLVGEEFITITGRMQVESFIDEPQSIPLAVEGGVLAKITLDGEAARVQIVQPQPSPPNQPPAQQAAPAPAPTSSVMMLFVQGKGRKALEMSVRYKVNRTGGWRIATGKVPAAAATAWDITAPQAQTEVRLASAAAPATTNAPQSIATQGPATVETKAENETIHAALPPDGAFHLQWRPKIAESQVDKSMIARSLAVLDIQEDGLRLAWQVNLEFGRSLHDSISFTVPAGFLVERVAGSNVRGWKTAAAEGVQTIEVTFLKAVSGHESLALLLSRRVTVGEGEMTSFSAPVVTVRDVALHQGTFVLRRSPLLDLRVGEATGLSRADIDAAMLNGVLASMTEESPLGIRPFQTYRFVATPFRLQLEAAPYAAKAIVQMQALLKVSEREHRYEARLNFTIENRPRFTAHCLLPAGLKLDSVEGPPGLQWTVKGTDPAQELAAFLPSGQREFSLVIRGRFTNPAGESFPAPRLEVRDVSEQTGYLVVQADPAYDVRAENLRGCESVLLERVANWLKDDQRQLARVVLYYATPDFAANLRLVPRQPRVNAFTITNVRVTPFAVEDTIYLHYTIQDAGIRQVSFRIPARMRDARITVPLLRQKTIEPYAADQNYVRVRLDLQDEVTQQLIVLVEHDRPLTGAPLDAPIPVVESARTDQRFVVLESAGRDEVQVTATDQLVELNRQQSHWAKLTGILGSKITQAFLVQDDATSPRLTMTTRQRTTVETAGAKIGLAKTLLVVDGFGAYRGTQEYHVDNKTEQFLEVELPEGAELWTARVAGEPVKPSSVPGTTNARRVRIPLIKTSAGDLDYPVELKYGGWLRLSGAWQKVAFPLMHTVKIQVEQSQVRLRLPDDFGWFDFGGSMRHVRDEGDLLVGFFKYQSKRVESLLDVANTSSDEFSKARATNNLKQLGLALHDYHDSYKSWTTGNVEFARELTNNTQLLQQAEQTINQQAQQISDAVLSDNRSVLSLRCATQELNRSKNVVTQLHENFDASGLVVETTREQKVEDGGFNRKWFEGNQLQTFEQLNKEQADVKAAVRDLTVEAKPLSKGSVGDAEGRAAANELGKKLADDSREEKSNDFGVQDESTRLNQRRLSELGQQVERYQQRLEQSGGALDRGGQMGGAGYGGGQAMGMGMPGMGPPQAGAPGVMRGQAVPAPANQPADAFNLRYETTPSSGATPPPAIAGMRSLDVDIPQVGQEYLFFTTRGEIAIDARVVPKRQVHRWAQLAFVIAGALIATAIVRRFAPRPAPAAA